MESHTLDPIDIKILNLLQTDGLMSNRELAMQTHRSPNPINERVARLKRLGIIKRTVAIIDDKKAKSLFISYIFIQLTGHSKENFKNFLDCIAKRPEIMECAHVTGRYDFVLKVVVDDLNAYNEFLTAHISTIGFVHKVESFPVLGQTKSETKYHL